SLPMSSGTIESTLCSEFCLRNCADCILPRCPDPRISSTSLVAAVFWAVAGKAAPITPSNERLVASRICSGNFFFKNCALFLLVMKFLQVKFRQPLTSLLLLCHLPWLSLLSLP